MDFKKIRGLSFNVFEGLDQRIWLAGVKKGKPSASSEIPAGIFPSG